MKKQIIPTTIVLITGVVLGCWYLDSIARAAISQATTLVAYAVGSGSVIGLLIGLVAGGLIAYERVKTERAKRRAVERDSRVLVVTAGEREQVFIREQDEQAQWRPLHLNPSQVQSSSFEPSTIELALYRLWHSRPQAASPDMPLLESGQATPELLPILDAAQRVLIIGASDAGKTNLLQWVVSRRVGAVIVVDPHAYPGKWPDKAKVVGAGSNHTEIETVLDNLIELMVSRYKEISQGLVREGEHPKLTILIDEWMSIAYQCQNATDVMVRLLTESRKAAMSVIIGSHSERVKSLGLDGKGDLRDGFLIVRLYVENGERRATYDYGRGERDCLLPGKYEPTQDSPVFEIEGIAEPKPTEQEQQILDLHRKGESFRAISQLVWGKHGQFYNDKIQQVLDKFGEK